MEKAAKRKPAVRIGEKISLGVVYFFTALTIFALLAIVSHVVIHGIPYINLEFLTQEPVPPGRRGGISSVIVGTFLLVALSVAIAAPLGVFAAIYLTEYAKKGKFLRLIRFGVEGLSGIPSIIFGLFGYVLFVSKAGPFAFGWSLKAGGLTLACMLLPTLIRTAEEAIKSVPITYREGSLALGATKLQTIAKVVVPSAIPGILTGVILSVGRAIGETAAVLLTAGSSFGFPKSLADQVRTLSVHVYLLSYEGVSEDKAYAAATILIILILLINFTANKLVGRYSKARG